MVLRRNRPARLFFENFTLEFFGCKQKYNLTKTATQFNIAEYLTGLRPLLPPSLFPHLVKEKTNHLWWEIISPGASADVIVCNMQYKITGLGKRQEWINKLWYIYTMEFYAAERKKELLLFTRAWMELESIMLSEISQEVRDKYHMISPLTGT